MTTPYRILSLNGTRYRIIKTPKGWISQVEVKNFLKKKWKDFDCYNGLSYAFPYKTDEKALSGLLEKINEDLKRQFYQI